MSCLTKVSSSKSNSTEFLEHNLEDDNIKQQCINHLKFEIEDSNMKEMFYSILKDNQYIPTKIEKLCIDLSLLLSLENKFKEEENAFLNCSISKFKDTDYKISKSELLYIIVKCSMIYNKESSIEKHNLFI